MSIKMGVMSADVDRQIDLLRVYDEIATKYYKPAFQLLTEAATGYIRPTIPVATGKAVSKFRGTVTGKGLKLAASIGWAQAKNAPWYINVVNYGSKAHPLEAGSDVRLHHGRENRKSLSFKSAYANPEGFKNLQRQYGLGMHVKIGRTGQWRTLMVHPGFAARGFMQAGAERLQPLIESTMGPANEAVAKELAVP